MVPRFAVSTAVAAIRFDIGVDPRPQNRSAVVERGDELHHPWTAAPRRHVPRSKHKIGTNQSSSACTLRRWRIWIGPYEQLANALPRVAGRIEGLPIIRAEDVSVWSYAFSVHPAEIAFLWRK